LDAPHDGQPLLVKAAKVDTVFGEFNSILVGALWILIEEVDFRKAKTASVYENFKAAVTADVGPVMSKGKDQAETLLLARIFMSANELSAVPTSGEDRQLFIQDVSPARMGDTEYFDRINRNMKIDAWCATFSRSS
jgi:hypothetical protein